MLLAFGCCLLLHFGLYVLALRHRSAFQRERVIFFYHLIPAVLVAGAAVGMVLGAPSAEQALRAVIVIGVQGIYSLTFLELWSLAQIGYSIDILMRCEQSMTVAVADLERVGEGKKAERLNGLLRLGLTECVGGRYHLSRRGRMITAALRWIRECSSPSVG